MHSCKNVQYINISPMPPQCRKKAGQPFEFSVYFNIAGTKEVGKKPPCWYLVSRNARTFIFFVYNRIILFNSCVLSSGKKVNFGSSLGPFFLVLFFCILVLQVFSKTLFKRELSSDLGFFIIFSF